LPGGKGIASNLIGFFKKNVIYIMPDYHKQLIPGHSYHIISHAVGNEKLFRIDDNYRFSLQRYQKHVNPVVDTFAFCLLPNHLHFLVRVKDFNTIARHFSEKKYNKEFHPEIVSDFIMERFSNWLNSYTKAFNKMFNRKGALFIDYLRRVEVEESTQYTSTIFYIHKNAVHHEYCNKIEDWKWSSYQLMLSHAKTWICKDEILEWFGGIELYKQFHQQPIVPKNAVILE
jgi:REP element-mobilizing transposase RayT